ncbi:FAD:protein FMN transferase [Neorhodopirellula lusitana]|nr:FAD:protein FMN transferase [Neorhodopirellula lusitana]
MTENRMTRRGLCLVAFFVLTCLLPPFVHATGDSGPDFATFQGATMGTTYTVKVSDPPSSDAALDKRWFERTAASIDRELRSVNDQMSTYLKSSELSQFNNSDSTDWFPVSDATAEVVLLALEIGEKSGGLFDVTVGPLVDRWSFGPGERQHDVPDEAELASIQKRTGQRHLHARLDPPAIKKDIADLRVDLSAIAKGHGVDRLVRLLNEAGLPNVFVEVGGEVRVTGTKRTPAGRQSWKVGIQKPDARVNQLALAHPMQDAAMATSGDYRNYFEVDGKRYSHTLNPTTGKPIEHSLASVTVIAESCAKADGWATALNVAGLEPAMQLAKDQGLDTLLIHRINNPHGEDMIAFKVNGTGTMAEIAERMNASSVFAQASMSTSEGSFAERMMPILILTAAGFGAVLLAMAVGVIFGRKAISGSCGGLNATTDADGTTRCSMCSTPSDGCKELRDKMAESEKLNA